MAEKTAKKERALVIKPIDGEAYSRQREKHLPVVQEMVAVMGLSMPQEMSQDERILVALTDDYGDIVHDILVLRLDATMLPIRLRERVRANVPREREWHERARHWFAKHFGAVAAAIGGAIAGIVDAFVYVLVSALSRSALVMGPTMLAFLLMCLWQTALHNQTGQSLTWDKISEMMLNSTWAAFIVFLVMSVLNAFWLWMQRREEDERVNKRRMRGSGSESG